MVITSTDGGKEKKPRDTTILHGDVDSDSNNNDVIRITSLIASNNTNDSSSSNEQQQQTPYSFATNSDSTPTATTAAVQRLIQQFIWRLVK